MRFVPKLAAFLIVVVLATAACVASSQSKRELIRMLREQGFGGALSGDIHFTPLGTLGCPASDYRVIYFEWYGPANPGSHRAQYRLLFLEGGKRYEGSYVISDKPLSVTPDLIVFGYDKASGNVISCSDIGPGKSVQLDGGEATFER